jgi:phage-related protein
MAEDLGDAEVTITLDDSSVNAAVNRLADRLESALDRASRDAGLRMQRNISRAVNRISPVTIRVTADVSRFQTSISALRNLPDLSVPVVPEIDRERFRAEVLAVLDGIEVSVRVVPDLSGFDERIRAHRPPSVNVPVNGDTRGFTRSLSTLGKVAGEVGKLGGLALGIGAVGASAITATNSIVSFIGALAPAAGILAAGPAAVAGYATALGTLKLATMGVSDAFGSALTDDSKKFQKVLEGLSPAVRKAALEVRALKPAFDELRNSVQSSFFGAFSGEITKVANALKGPLKSAMVDIAGNFGDVVSQVAQFVRGAGGVKDVTNILKGTTAATADLDKATLPVAKGFLDLAGNISAAFGTRVNAALTKVGNTFGDFLIKIANNGQAVDWVNGAVTVFKQLGSIVSNVGSIIASVFRAANAVGGGLLNNIIAITDSLSAFAKSAAGQSAISNIFTTLATAARAIGPILTNVIKQLGGLAPSLTLAFTAIGPAINQLVTALGGALKNALPGVVAIFQQLSKAVSILATSGALEAVGHGLSLILTAVAPLIPPLVNLGTTIIIGLAPVLSTLATALGAVVQAITPVVDAVSSALLPILAPLTDALNSVITALGPVIPAIGTQLAQAVIALTPSLVTMSQAIGNLVVALAPLLPQLINQLLPSLPLITNNFVQLITALTPLVPQISQLLISLAPLISDLIEIAGPIITVATAFDSWVVINGLVPIIGGLVSALNRALQSFTEIIIGAQTLASNVRSSFSGLATGAISSVTVMVTRVSQLWTQVKAFVIGAVTSMVSTAVSTLSGLPGRARSAISGLTGTVGSVVSSAASRAVSDARSLVSRTASTLGSLTSRARSALGNVGGALVGAGRSLVAGFASGIRAAAGGVASAARNMVSNAISAARSALHIGSPSRLFIQFGKWTGQGLSIGLDAMQGLVARSATSLVNPVVAAGSAAARGMLSPQQRLSSTMAGGTSRTTSATTPLPQGTGRTTNDQRTSMINNFNITGLGNPEQTARSVVNQLMATVALP